MTALNTMRRYGLYFVIFLLYAMANVSTEFGAAFDAVIICMFYSFTIDIEQKEKKKIDEQQKCRRMSKVQA